MIKLISVSNQHLDELLVLAKTTFTSAFKDQNSPENFRLYMQKAFNRSIFLEQLNNPDMCFYFIKKQDITVGYIKLNERNAQNEQFDVPSIELERFYIQRNFQGQNIGQQVLQKVIQIAKEKEVDFLWLGVWDRNHKAIRFYERHGFVKFGSHPYFLGNDEQTDFLMKFDLTPPPPLS